MIYEGPEGYCYITLRLTDRQVETLIKLSRHSERKPLDVISMVFEDYGEEWLGNQAKSSTQCSSSEES